MCSEFTVREGVKTNGISKYAEGEGVPKQNLALMPTVLRNSILGKCDD